MKGKLYGIGVGPGDPELMTLKAKRLIEECDIVAVPVKREGEESVALHIARGAADVPEEKVRRVLFTMNKDKAKREACRQAAAETIMAFLDEGQNVAMPVLGDVGIYSTYSYVHKRLIKAGGDDLRYPVFLRRGQQGRHLHRGGQRGLWRDPVLKGHGSGGKGHGSV